LGHCILAAAIGGSVLGWISFIGGVGYLVGINPNLFAPFGSGSPEPVDASALICKSCEIIGLITLVALVFLGQTFNYTASTSRLIGEALTISLIAGLFFWG
jgi:hypothetical protein